MVERARDTQCRHVLLNTLLDLVFAPVCLGCDAPIPLQSARLICSVCRTRLIPVPAPACERCGSPRLTTGRADDACVECPGWPAVLRSARSACVLHPPADRIVHQLKYRSWHALAEPMGRLMAGVQLPQDAVDEARFVVPVPTSAVRRRTRGYNQAELLARHYARITGRSVIDALERAEGTTQTALQPAERRANVAGAFRLRHNAQRALVGAHVLLIDDVLTTGATAIEAAQTLAGAGVRCVSVVTFARALDAARLL
jgi:ComF family protein